MPGQQVDQKLEVSVDTKYDGEAIKAAQVDIKAMGAEMVAINSQLKSAQRAELFGMKQGELKNLSKDMKEFGVSSFNGKGGFDKWSTSLDRVFDGTEVAGHGFGKLSRSVGDFGDTTKMSAGQASKLIQVMAGMSGVGGEWTSMIGRAKYFALMFGPIGLAAGAAAVGIRHFAKAADDAAKVEKEAIHTAGELEGATKRMLVAMNLPPKRADWQRVIEERAESVKYLTEDIRLLGKAMEDSDKRARSWKRQAGHAEREGGIITGARQEEQDAITQNKRALKQEEHDVAASTAEKIKIKKELFQMDRDEAENQSKRQKKALHTDVQNQGKSLGLTEQNVKEKEELARKAAKKMEEQKDLDARATKSVGGRTSVEQDERLRKMALFGVTEKMTQEEWDRFHVLQKQKEEIQQQAESSKKAAEAAREEYAVEKDAYGESILKEKEKTDAIEAQKKAKIDAINIEERAEERKKKSASVDPMFKKQVEQLVSSPMYSSGYATAVKGLAAMPRSADRNLGMFTMKVMLTTKDGTQVIQAPVYLGANNNQGIQADAQVGGSGG